jgi:MFS family permease
MLAERFGGKWVFSVFYLMSTLGTILTPVAAEIHYGVLILCRVFVGIGSVRRGGARGRWRGERENWTGREIEKMVEEMGAGVRQG